jgi:hypothetical protein
MTLDTTYSDQNRASTERIRALVARLSDEDMKIKVGEHWTVSIALAHLAWWDRRVMYVLDMTEKDGKLFDLEINIAVNDLSLPLWEVIPARDAARICIETSEALDKRLEGFSPQLLEELYNHNRRLVVRALHRNEHLDEVEAGLRIAKVSSQ